MLTYDVTDFETAESRKALEHDIRVSYMDNPLSKVVLAAIDAVEDLEAALTSDYRQVSRDLEATEDALENAEARVQELLTELASYIGD